jgi:hypothetical protein
VISIEASLYWKAQMRILFRHDDHLTAVRFRTTRPVSGLVVPAGAAKTVVVAVTPFHPVGEEP